jgi:hypothetical protein
MQKDRELDSVTQPNISNSNNGNAQPVASSHLDTSNHLDFNATNSSSNLTLHTHPPQGHSQTHSNTPFRLQLASVKASAENNTPTSAPNNFSIGTFTARSRDETHTTREGGAGNGGADTETNTTSHTTPVKQQHRPSVRKGRSNSKEHDAVIHTQMQLSARISASSSVSVDELHLNLNVQQRALDGGDPHEEEDLDADGDDANVSEEEDIEEYEDDDDYDDESDASDSVFGDSTARRHAYMNAQSQQSLLGDHLNTLTNDEINDKEIAHLKEILGLGAKGVEGAKVAQLFVSADRFAQMTATTIQRDMELVRHMSTIQLRQKNVFTERPWTARQDGGINSRLMNNGGRGDEVYFMGMYLFPLLFVFS